MWLACYTQAEIAEAVGYSEQAISQFVKSLNFPTNGAGAVSGEIDENSAVGNAERYQEFPDDEESEGTNSLGVYEIKRPGGLFEAAEPRSRRCSEARRDFARRRLRKSIRGARSGHASALTSRGRLRSLTGTRCERQAHYTRPEFHRTKL
jgi:hypothetical protein